ncbi:hypothetical protein DFH08DRAFT_915944 [Mycena albidolilacea]|uniref:DUF6589 domain-containing protein n=1 Tax=Mycena albidolilacea TaxID=1033008 RepID=A0AAD6ZSE9_9AGAR|nr:hypothetical protein DFH08DRAFT_915944 [Mycena albidolilacea]
MDLPPNPTPVRGKIVRSYNRKAPLDPSPTISAAPPADYDFWAPEPSNFFSPAPDFPHVQPRLRATVRTAADILESKFAAMDEFLQNYAFDSIGDFLSILFYNRPHGESDPRGPTHAVAVAHFLRGRTDIKVSKILPLIHHHRCSYPAKDSSRLLEREMMFSTTREASTIHHTRPFLSTWAAKLVATEARKQIGRATHDDPENPDARVQLRASTNGRRKAALHVVTWDDFKNFSVQRLAETFQYMSAPMEKGAFIVRKRRPYPMIQVAAISSFIIARNQYATGHMAMLLGIWHFVCKSHVDVKRVYCRFGNVVSDTTARAALRSMTADGMEKMRADTQDANTRGETEHCLLLDNVQEYDRVYEPGLGLQNRPKVGTAGTKVKLQPCAPGAFDARDYYARVARKERKTMTVTSIFADIDWNHEQRVRRLHWVRILADFIPQLHSLRQEITTLFRTAPIARRPMPDDQPPTECQPLMLNSERETESQGMLRAVKDFDKQIGVDIETNPHSLSWIRGDGASYAQVLRLSRYTAPIGNFKNKITTPEIWHTGATDPNSIAENHYGPATSSDPSSLSKASNCAGLKRPSNLKSCDYYPTVRSLTVIWTAHILDCWRLFYETDDLEKYSAGLETAGQLPDLDTILDDATMLADRYTSQAAIQNSMRTAEATSPKNPNPFPVGTPCIAQREPGFTGDRVLRNSEIFLLEFRWWIEMAWSVSEGDTGRVWEIIKIWIFKFAGSLHQNYMKYLLEFYCLLRYEASEGLSDAILDNLLLRIDAELGKCIPGDLLQEHYNKWLQAMSRRHGGELDDPFFHQTVSPNVEHFLRFKENIETAFNLKRRGKAHTSPHQRPELRLLLTMFKDEEVHTFRAGRSMGHAAVNQFARGVRQLDEGKLQDFIESTTCLGDCFAEIHRNGTAVPVINRDESPEHSDQSDASSANSVVSIASLESVLSSPIDPNEPENGGEDMSDVPRSSGSFYALYIDDEGNLRHDEEEEDEDETDDGEIGGAEENEEEAESNSDNDCVEDEL